MAKIIRKNNKIQKPTVPWRNRLRKIGKIVGLIMIGLFLLQLLVIIAFKWIPLPITPLIVMRGIDKSIAGEKTGYSKTWKSFDQMSDHIKLAVICSEDQRFFEHYGFDFGAIEKAMEYNVKQQKKGTTKRRGASTISQQTAKNVFLWPSRTWIRKGLEFWFTFWIELIWGKKRILEVYLNVVELGDGIYGAEAAAQRYWKTSALKLNAERAALLAAALPSPRRYNVSNPGSYMQKRQQWVLRQMRYNQHLKEKI
jgi:monofunctional biosynthetic peptidoglycan transglycosylase